MINILIPMSGPSLYEKPEGFAYPKILTEVAGKTLLEYSQKPFLEMEEECRLIYVLPKKEKKEFSLDAILNVVTDSKATFVDIHGQTKGALCTALMAVDQLDLEQELIISSSDHYINQDMNEVLSFFRQSKADAGVLCFESVHPKWSYALLNEGGEVLQTSEKRPISNHAMTGLFYFKKAGGFIEAAMNVIRKQAHINESYFVSSALNECILLGARVLSRSIEKNKYHSFYDTHSIKAFEDSLCSGCFDIEALSHKYADKFNAKDIEGVLDFFVDDLVLIDPVVSLEGRQSLRNFLSDFFESAEKFKFEVVDIHVSAESTVIEFVLRVNGEKYKGADVITWCGGKIKKINAYLYRRDK